MRTQATREIFDHWVQLCGDQAAPLRTQIDPMLLRRVLPHLFIVITEGSDDPTFRLAGTRICDLFGTELKGLAFKAIWSDSRNAQPLEICRSAIQYERPALLDVLAEGMNGSRPYEMLLLPLRPGPEASDRVLGALVPQAQALSVASPPINGLALQKWTFLEKDGAKQTPEDTDAQRDGPAMRGLLGLRSFGTGRAF
ncbi:PAS domain-containing protein [Neorhizobium lilium]|nr:PAS domain-containing protein [Neorhizobium lilium]